MPIELSEIVLLIVSFILSAFYSGSEAALVSLPVDRIKQLIEEGGRKGRALEFMSQKANEMLTTILVGNNLVNIFAASLTTTISERIFKNDALAVSVGITTLVILIFGEIAPKMFSRTHAEKLAVPVIRVLQVNYYLFYPVVNLFTWVISKVLGKNAELSGRLVTRDDIEYMVNQAEKEKTIDSKQLDLLNSILEFPTIKVKDIMIPRMQVRYLQWDFKFEELVRELKQGNHSRYPVCQTDLDKTIGFLHVKDIVFLNDKNRTEFNLNRYVKPPFFVYEHMKIQSVFDYMNRKKVHLALVKDENGTVIGIVTLEDIMEEIFGEIHDEHDKVALEDLDAEVNSSEGIIVEGLLSLRDLYNEYDIKIPLNDNFSTLAGFLLDLMGNNFPEENMMFFWEGFSFKILKVDDHRIMKVRVCDVEGEKHIFSKSLAEKQSTMARDDDGKDSDSAKKIDDSK
ncbi:hemolysin family protein [Bacteriovoracaceae bacterium]|nr:hemolysin family protein [Bacteriovoracaceae bacterium]